MGSTYLDLTNKVLRRLNEVELTSTDFISARGIHATAKDAVLATVRKINTQKYEWPFNKAAGTQVLTAGTVEYAWPADLKIPDWESFYIQNDGVLALTTTTLKQISKELYWEYFRNQDLDDTDGIGLPDFVFETSGGGFGVTPSPDEAYTVKYTYFINTVTLSADSDVCTIPSQFDYIIVDGALHYMYAFLDNSERATLFEKNYNEGVASMAYILIPQSPVMNSGQYNPGGIPVLTPFPNRLR